MYEAKQNLYTDLTVGYENRKSLISDCRMILKNTYVMKIFSVPRLLKILFLTFIHFCADIPDSSIIFKHIFSFCTMVKEIGCNMNFALDERVRFL